MNQPPKITITANGASQIIALDGPVHGTATGTFASAEITFETSLDEGASWAPDTETTFSAPSSFAMPHLAPCWLRAQTTEATGSTNVMISFRPIV